MKCRDQRDEALALLLERPVEVSRLGPEPVVVELLELPLEPDEDDPDDDEVEPDPEDPVWSVGGSRTM